jgi:hypothetical protein
MRNHRGSNNANFRESQPLVPPPAATAGDSSRTVYNTVAPSGRVMGGGSTNAVFGNLSAKPSVGEKLEEFPPVCF